MTVQMYMTALEWPKRLETRRGAADLFFQFFQACFQVNV